MRELADRPQVQVVSDQYGSPTYAPHLAQALLRLIDSRAYGTYHIAGAGGTSRFELTRTLYRLLRRAPFPKPPHGHAMRSSPLYRIPPLFCRPGRTACRPLFRLLVPDRPGLSTRRLDKSSGRYYLSAHKGNRDNRPSGRDITIAFASYTAKGKRVVLLISNKTFPFERMQTLKILHS